MKKDQIIWNFNFTLIYAVLIIISGYILHSENRLPQTIPILDLAVVSFAVFRLIRLFVYDSVTQYIREYFDKFETGPKRTLADLLSCPWCTGVWMAFFVAFFYFLTPYSWWPIFIFALAGMGTYLQIIIIRIGYKL